MLCLLLRFRQKARPRSLPAPSAQPIALLALGSIHWRKAWKYGERAYRYCQLDVGHAAAAVTFAAAALGQSVQPLYHLGDDKVAQLLGLDRAEEFYPDEMEHPDLLLALTAINEATLAAASDWCAGGQWYGRANRLDPRHDYQWPLIDEVSAAAVHPASPPAPPTP